MRLIIFPFSLKILSKVYFFLMIKQSDETVEFERKKIFDPLFIDIDLFYVPFIPPIRILVGGPSNQYGKKESSTRSILSKIGREFIRFLWGETCGWKERKISHFEEISFFLFLIRERNRFPSKTDDDGKLHHRFGRCGWGLRLNQKIQTCDPFHISVFINIHEERILLQIGYITIQG